METIAATRFDSTAYAAYIETCNVKPGGGDAFSEALWGPSDEVAKACEAAGTQLAYALEADGKSSSEALSEHVAQIAPHRLQLVLMATGNTLIAGATPTPLTCVDQRATRNAALDGFANQLNGAQQDRVAPVLQHVFTVSCPSETGPLLGDD